MLIEIVYYVDMNDVTHMHCAIVNEHHKEVSQSLHPPRYQSLIYKSWKSTGVPVCWRFCRHLYSSTDYIRHELFFYKTPRQQMSKLQINTGLFVLLKAYKFKNGNVKRKSLGRFWRFGNRVRSVNVNTVLKIRMLKGSGTVIRFMKWKATRTHKTHQTSLIYVQN